jgi:metallo-beta-lactamase family protein
MYITSYGAAEGVTGSCHLLEVGKRRVLLDCGIFQGSGAHERNEPPFPFDPSSIDEVVVSHAHLDHIGRLPLLWKEGFRGNIISTPATYELARMSLLDSAGVMAANTRRRNRHRDKRDRREPIYDEQDVLDLLDRWNRRFDYGETVELCRGITVTPGDAGHILGSVFLHFQLEEDSRELRFTFSGDLGNVNKPIIEDPSACPESDVVMVESTYGDRDHRDFDASVVELEQAIRETFERGGNVVIPTFALERAQELLYVLYEAWKAGRIPHGSQVFLDSPMAINATRIFERHTDLFDAEALDLHGGADDPFDFEALEYTRDTRDSMAINDIKSHAIILAGSGMVTGGRVGHHLKHNLPRPESSVVFIGFQAAGTPGRQMVDGADSVRIMGLPVRVKSRVYTINGFSAHAGQRELTEWVRGSNASTVLLVHGEAETKAAFKAHLEAEGVGDRVEVQAYGVRQDLLAMARGEGRP